MVDGIIEIPIPGQPLACGSGPNGGRTRRDALPHFLVGPENHLVATAIRVVLDGPMGEYNPLVIHGPSGTGKSHLALGLAASWMEKYPHEAVVYTTAVDFARELTDALETHAINELRTRFHKCSLLVFEDLAELAGRQAAQQELVCTLSELLSLGKRVVATAVAPPAALSGLLPALRSRLAAGLTVELSRPGLDSRRAILQRLARSQDVALPESAARLLADGLPVTIPELFGAVVQLQAAADLNGEVIDADAARRYLADRHASRCPSLREIGSATARHFCLKLSDLQGPSRRRTVVTARGVAVHLARHVAGKSLQHIGRYFGGRDHTTVMHACHKIECLLKTDPTVREAVEQLQKRWQPTGGE